MKKMFLVFVLLHSCGPEFDFESKHHLYIYNETTSHTITKHEIDTITQEVLNEFPRHRHQIKDYFYATHVFFEEKIIQNKFYGLNQGGEIFVSYLPEWTCILKTAFIHELLHTVEHAIGLHSDYNHNRKGWWTAGSNSHMGHIKSKCQMLCKEENQ